MDFHYAAEDLIESFSEWKETSVANNMTHFDKMLQRGWKDAVNNGLFKYTLEDCKYKVLVNSSMAFVAQLNPQRGFNRRKREKFNSMNDPFNEEKFSFKKIDNDEILFSIHPNKNTAACTYDSTFSCRNDHIVVINVSPIDNCHILFVPELDRCLPQRMTTSSLLAAFDFTQLSSHPGFRVGFNSLHAWASINHLHFHAMYLDYPLYIDNHPASRHVQSNCFLLDDFVLSGFVFTIPIQVGQRIQVAEEAISIVNLLHEEEIAYNTIITRGKVGTRLVIFPRQSTRGKLPSQCFDVACVEVGGQLPIKTEEEYNNLTFEKAVGRLDEESLSKEEFSQLLEKVKNRLLMKSK